MNLNKAHSVKMAGNQAPNLDPTKLGYSSFALTNPIEIARTRPAQIVTVRRLWYSANNFPRNHFFQAGSLKCQLVVI
jgi:hypothetical protein